MEVEWKKDMHQSYLLLKKEGENSYCVNMLLNNPIRGLIRPELAIIDNQYIFRYETTSLQSVSNIIEKLHGEDLRKLLFDLFEILKEGKEYLLNEDDYILEPEYMFYSITRKELWLCYLDGYHKGVREQIASWMEYLMGKINHKDRDDVILVYGLYQISTNENSTFQDLVHYMNTYQEEEEEREREEGNGIQKPEEPYKMEDWGGSEGANKDEEEGKGSRIGGKWNLGLVIPSIAIPILLVLLFQTGLLRDGMTGNLDWSKAGCVTFIAILLEGYILSKINQIRNQGISLYPSENECDREEERESKEDMAKERGDEYDAAGGDLIYTEEKEELTGEGYGWIKPLKEKDGRWNEEEEELCENTVILREVKEEKRYLLRPNETDLYQDIVIVEIPFFIGKLKAKADGVIDNKLISRYHAKIHKEKEEFYLTDLASTNGTFLNGDRLGTNEKRRLCLNDEVGFANITYRFIAIGD